MCRRFSRCCQNSSSSGHDAVAAPELRPLDLAARRARPRARARAPRARSRDASGSLCRDASALIRLSRGRARKIASDSSGATRSTRALDAHLPSERVPVEEQRRTLVLRELAPLAARVARARRRSRARRRPSSAPSAPTAGRLADAVASAHACGSGRPSARASPNHAANWRNGSSRRSSRRSARSRLAHPCPA